MYTIPTHIAEASSSRRRKYSIDVTLVVNKYSKGEKTLDSIYFNVIVQGGVVPTPSYRMTPADRGARAHVYFGQNTRYVETVL